jgi:hypothetical protein
MKTLYSHLFPTACSTYSNAYLPMWFWRNDDNSRTLSQKWLKKQCQVHVTQVVHLECGFITIGGDGERQTKHTRIQHQYVQFPACQNHQVTLPIYLTFKEQAYVMPHQVHLHGSGITSARTADTEDGGRMPWNADRFLPHDTVLHHRNRIMIIVVRTSTPSTSHFVIHVPKKSGTNGNYIYPLYYRLCMFTLTLYAFSRPFYHVCVDSAQHMGMDSSKWWISWILTAYTCTFMGPQNAKSRRVKVRQSWCLLHLTFFLSLSLKKHVMVPDTSDILCN